MRTTKVEFPESWLTLSHSFFACSLSHPTQHHLLSGNIRFTMPPIRSHTRQLNNVLIKVTSKPFVNVLHNHNHRGAILAQISHGDLQQDDMVVTINAKRDNDLAATFHDLQRKHQIGRSIHQYYRVSGILRTARSTGESKSYFLDASSIVRFSSRNVSREPLPRTWHGRL